MIGISLSPWWLANNGPRVINLIEANRKISDGWSFAGGGSPTLSTVDGEDRVSWTSGVGNVVLSPDISVVSGETYTLSFRVKMIDLDGANPLTGFEIALQNDARTEGHVGNLDNYSDGAFYTVSGAHTFAADSADGLYLHFRHKTAGSPVVAFDYVELIRA